MAKHFLYLTNDRLLAVIWQGGNFTSRASFATRENDDGGEFEQYLAQHKDIPAYFFVDLIEEDFRLETMPHLRSSDAQAVQSRKLAQIYRNTPYRHAIIQGRETEGRRHDYVLYHAITNPDLLKPWLESLARAQIPLEGIYSSPVSSSCLMSALGLTQHNTLLVTMVPDSGLRQTFFQEKHMKFSRLTPLTNEGTESIAQQIASEAGRTWQYLESLRFFTVEERLEVFILAHKDDQGLIAEEMKRFPFLRYRFLDISEVARTIKLKSIPSQSRAEEIFIQCYANATLENHYAESADRRFATYRRTRIGLYTFTALTLAAGIAGTTYFLQQAGNVGTGIDKHNREAAQIQAAYQQVSSAVRNQSLNSDSVRDSALFYISQMRPLPAPGSMLRELSQVFADFPDISLRQINWETSNDVNATPAFTAASGKYASSIQSEIRQDASNNNASAAARSPSQNANDADPPYQGNKVQIAIVEGVITPFDGNYRRALARVDTLVKGINSIPGVKARTLSRPLDTGANTFIKAGGAPPVGPGETGFVLRVQFDPQATALPDNKS